MTGSGQLALPKVLKWSGGPSGCPGVVGRPSWMSGSGREALPDVREWSGGPPGCPGVVKRPSSMSKSGWEALLDVREWLGDHSSHPGVVGGPPGCPGVVGSPSRKFGRSARRPGNGRDTLLNIPERWKALSDVRQLLGGPPVCAGGPPGCPGVVGRPCRMSGSCQKVLPDTREWLEG